METPTLIPLVICDTKGIAKDPHPLGARPVKPSRNDFKNDEQFQKALTKYVDDDANWMKIDSTLNQYTISSIKCESAIMVSAKVLHFHIGTKIKAQVLPDGTVIADGFKYNK